MHSVQVEFINWTLNKRQNVTRLPMEMFDATRTWNSTVSMKVRRDTKPFSLGRAVKMPAALKYLMPPTDRVFQRTNTAGWCGDHASKRDANSSHGNGVVAVSTACRKRRNTQPFIHYSSPLIITNNNNNFDMFYLLLSYRPRFQRFKENIDPKKWIPHIGHAPALWFG